MNGILKKDLRVVLTGVMIFISYQVYSNPESGTKEQGDVYRNLPFSMPEVSQPSFPIMRLISVISAHSAMV